MTNEINDGGIFDDLMEDNGRLGMYDPLDDSGGYAQMEDFDKFQNESKATREASEGYIDIHSDIMDDVKQEEPVQTSDMVEELLRSKGYNPEAIKFENEDGEIETVSFNELSREEQLELLNAEHDNPYEDLDFTESEIEAVEFLRDNNMTLQELAQTIRQQVQEELSGQVEQTYQVDDFSDDELFIVDFKHKYGEDFTDEELIFELEKARENEELFNRKIGKLRSDYKQYEEEAREEQQREAELAQQQEHENYISQMVHVARGINDMHDTAELDDNDKNLILSYMFDPGPTGQTQMQKALSDPETMFKVAWYLQYGDETFKEMNKYYKGEIAKYSKQNNATKPKQKPETVIKDNSHQHTKRKPESIEDLWG